MSHKIVNSAVQWFNPTAFTDATSGYATTRRNQFSNPGYYDFDLAVQKSTPITESVSFQVRADIFNLFNHPNNLFNHPNLAPLGILSDASENGTINSTIGVALGNPGVGPGEPLNAQFSVKLLF